VQWRREQKDVEVIVLRDTSESTTNVKTFPKPGTSLQPALDRYFLSVANTDSDKEPSNRVGVISFQQSPSVDALRGTKLSLTAHSVRDAWTGIRTMTCDRPQHARAGEAPVELRLSKGARRAATSPVHATMSGARARGATNKRQTECAA
jgi:hypothetical protein